MARKYKKYKRNRYKSKPRKWKAHGEWVEREYGFDKHLSAAPYHYHKKSQLLNIILILAFATGAGFFTQVRSDSPFRREAL